MLTHKNFAGRLAACIAAGLILTASTTQPVHGASAKVTIPSFTVTINGTVMDNAYSEYPCIVYKGITYFPMTYYDCRFLGLETDWNQTSGLVVAKGGNQWEYKPYKRTSKNGSSYTAATASGAITVNGEAIDNSKEDYPLLLFRGVTYFPLTWRFAVESFGWSYEYTDAKGLVIQSGLTGSDGAASPGSGDGSDKAGDGSGTGAETAALPAVELILPVARFQWDDDQNVGWGSFVESGGYYYYQGEKGHIYQSPVTNPSEKKSLHQLPDGDGYATSYRRASIWEEKGKVCLSYWVGGATMGHEELYLLGADGSCTDIAPPASDFWYGDFGTVQFYSSTGMGGGTLYYRDSGQAEYTEVKWQDGPTLCRGVSAYLGGDHIIASCYSLVTGSDGSQSWSESPYLYKVNFRTGEREKLLDHPVEQYGVLDNTLYFYRSQQKALYTVPLSGGTAAKLADVAEMDYFLICGKNVFYVSPGGALYKAGQKEPLIDGAVDSVADRGAYLHVSMVEGGSPYRTILLDKDGREIGKTIENLVDLYVKDGKVVYVKAQ